MKKSVLKSSVKIFLVLGIILGVFEIQTSQNNRDSKQKSYLQGIAEENQYIPKDLNYSDVIKQIRKDEGTEEETNVVSEKEDTDFTEDTITGTPQEYMNLAKNYINEAMAQTDEIKKRYYVKKAYKSYRQYLKYFPESLDGMLGAGAMATYLGREDDAKNMLMQAYALYPKNPNVHKALGDYSFKFSNYNNAIDYYNLSLASGNLKDFKTNLATAVCYEKLGDIESAIEYFKVAQFLNPESDFANQRVQMYEAMEYEGYNSDTRKYEEANKPDENNDIELENLIIDAQQIK